MKSDYTLQTIIEIEHGAVLSPNDYLMIFLMYWLDSYGQTYNKMVVWFGVN